MSDENFQVDGVGINKIHYTGWKKADFVNDIIESLTARFGTNAQKKQWAEKAFDLMNPVEDKVEKVK